MVEPVDVVIPRGSSWSRDPLALGDHLGRDVDPWGDHLGTTGGSPDSAC